jgi:hypothetical protein
MRRWNEKRRFVKLMQLYLEANCLLTPLIKDHVRSFRPKLEILKNKNLSAIDHQMVLN